MKLAPVLSALLSDLRAKVRPGKAGAGDAQVIRLAAAELLGLLAVARAAEKWGQDTYVGDTIANIGEGHRALCRALDRLDRLSNPSRVAGKAKR